MKDVSRKNILRFSLILFIIAVVVFIFNFLVFHFVTDNGITTVFQTETDKPVVVAILSLFGTLMLSSSVVSFVFALVFYKK